MTRNGCTATISIPGNSMSRFAAITCSCGMNRSPSGSGVKRAMFGGTFTRANRRMRVEGSRATTARFSDRSEMYGNGCAGSTESGVRIGNTRFSNVCRRCTRSSPPRSSQSTTLIPAASSRGRTLFAQIWCWRFMSSRTRPLIASSCSRAVMPSGEVVDEADGQLLLQTGHADLEELVEVVAEDGEEPHPLEERPDVVLGQGQHAGVEVQPGELAVREPAGGRHGGDRGFGGERAPRWP